MNQIFIMVLLLGLASPAFGLPSSIGGGTVGPVVQVNACGCNWDDAEYVPEGLETTCISCDSNIANINCASGKICDDNKSGNSYGVIVGSENKLTVECGTWVPQQEVGGVIRAGYWSVIPSATCDTVATYRCGAGYYGKPTSETAGCSKCPGFEPSGEISAISSEIPRTAITNCYIKANKAMSDTTGTYIYTDGCFYKK